MQDGSNLGFEISPEERTPLVEALLRIIQTERENHQRIVLHMQRQIDALTEEVNRLKGLPEKPKRPRQPSSLNDPQGKPSENDLQGEPTQTKPLPTGPDGKRAGSAKRSKTLQFAIHQTIPLEPPSLPDGAVGCGTRNFVVQDLCIEAVNTCYERRRYLLPDGSYLTAALPADVQGHFGPTLRAYVLYQHHHNQVTQPLLWEELREFGIDISTGQIDNLLTQGHDRFHAEKDDLLPTAREVSSYLQTDDTSAKHRGKAGHTLHIGNEFFASFTTSDTKSRVNFLKVLLAPFHEYTLNGDTLTYLKAHPVPVWVFELAAATNQVIVGDQAWEAQLNAWGITNDESRRLLTEAALWATLSQHELYTDVALISDDAKQFQVQGFLHGLCWLHAERHVAGLIPLTDADRTAHLRSRDDIWTFYQRLKQYRITPTAVERVALEAEFDRILQPRTGWSELDEALRKIHVRKERLLLVLTHPEIPLHNNLSENDIRQYVKKRKISAGTRSDLGRRCRDTFLSLKTTCRKLGQRFWSYLRDRFQRVPKIPLLADLIRKRATAAALEIPGLDCAPSPAY